MKKIAGILFFAATMSSCTGKGERKVDEAKDRMEEVGKDVKETLKEVKEKVEVKMEEIRDTVQSKVEKLKKKND